MTLVAPPRVGVPLRIVCVAAAVLTITIGAIAAGEAVGGGAGRPDIVDFHEVYLAGRLAAEGRLAQAYDPAVMAPLQRAFGGRDVFLPFGYPPPFALLLAPLSRLPLVAAFVVFDIVTLALFVGVVRRLAGPWAWPALLATSPAVLIDLKIGQNGLLTAGLAGLSIAALIDRRSVRGGLFAGALGAIKPHLAATLPLLLLVRRDWRGLAAAAVGCALLWGVALALFGPASVAAFVGSLGFAGRFMAAGAFPLHRMASIYAAALGAGVSPSVALVLQGLAALAALGTAVTVALRQGDARVSAGLLLASAALVSPYLYDYDLPVFGMGLAPLLPALAARLAPGRTVALLTAVASIESIGLLQTALAGSASGPDPSLMGPPLLVCFGIVCRVLGRSERAGAGTTAIPVPETHP